ncbi:MAG: sulfotransferase [Flavobacteriales bacterium]|jgi:hypothetical protein|nr:sulfotransferase [Flavobacteriales bacterium]
MSSIPDKQYVFVVGAPRSGTTWLHRMLAEHPSVASINAELTLFSSYLAPVVKRFKDETFHRDRGHWDQGLPMLFSQQEFDSAIRSVTGMTYARVLNKNPAASHILDKHPAYSLHIPLIDQLLPNSRFIHIIRDGREVVVSMMSAKRRLGFGEGDVRGASLDWANHIRQARAEGSKLGASRYMEVSYEALMETRGSLLKDVFDFAGLPLTDTEIGQIASKHAIDNQQVSGGDAALNKLRKIPGAIWRSKLTLQERWTLDELVGDLLFELEQARPGWWALNASERRTMTYRRLKIRARQSVRELLHLRIPTR